MTEAMKDRPASLIRRGPKPAPDEAIDPVDAAPQPRAQPATDPTILPQVQAEPQNSNTTSRPSRRREVTIPLGTRLSVPVMEVLDQAVHDQEITIREALEQAIVSRWGKN